MILKILALAWYLVWVVPTIVLLTWNDADYNVAIGTMIVVSFIGFAGAMALALKADQ